MSYLSSEEMAYFALATIKVNLRSHKNIKKITVSKFKHLFGLNAKLSEIPTYQALSLFYGEELGLFSLDLDLKNINNIQSDKIALKKKLLECLKHTASEKQMHYFLQQLQKIISTPKIDYNIVLVVLHDKFNQLNIVVLDNNFKVLDKIIIEFLLSADAWWAISFELVKLLVRYNLQHIICSLNSTSHKGFNTVMNNIYASYPNLNIKVSTVPLIGAFAFARQEETIVNYPDLTESQRAAIFLAKHAKDPKFALSSLDPSNIVFDPIQSIFDKSIWNNKIKKILHPEVRQEKLNKTNVNKKVIINTAMADALKKLKLG